MTRDELIEIFAAKAAADERVLALFLGGSLGAGTGDAFSDADFILVAAPPDHGALVAGARDWAGGLAELVLWKTPYPGLPLFCAVTENWGRFDLTVTVPGAVRGAKDRLKPLVDKAGVWDGLPESLPPRPPAPGEIEALVEETLRILGLLPVAVGRAEFVVAATGVGLLRDQLIALMVAETAPPVKPGALGLKRVLPPKDLAILETAPVVAPTRESVTAASLAYAALFLPRARDLAERIGATWPQALEDAARAHLRRTVGLELPPSRPTS